MTEIVIRDVPIRFPYKPYSVQEDYMSKVLECLQKGQNGVLESPTGTGKTLSLLCSSLAWLQLKKAHLQASTEQIIFQKDADQALNIPLLNDVSNSSGNSQARESSWSKSFATPQIIYASRTHAQLSQVMSELKRTAYSYVRAAVLGSRDQLCIHPDLAKEQGNIKILMCKEKTSKRTCHYNTNLESRKRDNSFHPTEVLDIEDLAKFGHKNQCCPYFLTRDMMSSADIVFMPYNYLLNPQTRQSQKINLSNTVVILDEAHNVEKMCEESASMHISSTDITLCISEVTQVMKKFSEEGNEDFADEIDKDFTASDLEVLKTMFLVLEEAIDKLDINKKGKTFPGSFIFDLLKKADITIEKMGLLESAVSSVAQYLSTTANSPHSRKGTSLLYFGDFLQVVSNSTGRDGKTSNTDLFYKVYVEPELPKGTKDSWTAAKNNITSSAKKINFWCFSPGFAMKSLVEQGVHCVILTSGTLSPLRATISELAIDVPITLENPHIIKSEQVSVTVLCKGPTNEKLISTYTNRDNEKYLADIGRALTNFCRVIPNGVLVFFPSYPVMEKTFEYWQKNGIWSQIQNFKPIFVEPKRREALIEVMNAYNTALELDGSRGAVLLAVLRGKVSEGMDFADARCRAVFVTGLPYPPLLDQRVILKREYVDALRRMNATGLTGSDWYNLEATRAVNQAVGRVIRHASDYGAIVFCDCRFDSQKITQDLSAWLRPHITRCDSFGPAYNRVFKFFKNMGDNPPHRPIQSGASFDYNEVKIRMKEKTEEITQKENNQELEKTFFEKVCQTHSKKATTQPSPAGLIDALDCSSTKDFLDVKKFVARPEEETESYVQPAPKRIRRDNTERAPRKRRLRMVPLNFNFSESANQDGNTAASASSASTSSASTSSENKEDRKKANLDYLLEVKRRIPPDDFLTFRASVKEYSFNEHASFDQVVRSLRRIFPDLQTKDLFCGFKKYVKLEHRAKFEDLCRTWFS